MSTTSVTRSRVVPGTSVTIARDAPASALNRLDLPDVRLADDRDLQTFANQPAAARVARAATSSASSSPSSARASAPGSTK